MEDQELIQLALDAGFTHAAVLPADKIQPLPEVRDMCAVNTCHRYGACWSCPPACGTLEECKERLSQYRSGLVVQVVGELEDSFDIEGLQELEKRQKEAFSKLLPQLREKMDHLLPLGTGSCTICKECTYPDAPCRFPDDSYSSMEAYGLWVSKVCEESGLPYNYGPQTIAFTSCYLLK